MKQKKYKFTPKNKKKNYKYNCPILQEPKSDLNTLLITNQNNLYNN